MIFFVFQLNGLHAPVLEYADLCSEYADYGCDDADYGCDGTDD